MIPLKSEKELVLLRKSGEILASILLQLERAVQPGITTLELDRLAEELISQAKAMPAFKGYRGFPGCICTSINDEVVHGIPGAVKLIEGDIISIDLGVNFAGYFSDAAVTVGVGKTDSKAKKLIEVAKQSLFEAIEVAKPGNRLSDISHAVQSFVERNGFSVVRDFVGHGIGNQLHEAPEIPNYGQAHQGPILKSGMVLAIEPMVNMGTWQIRMQENGWTAATKDGNLSAHFEHTVAITQNGAEILTLTNG